MKGFQGVVKKNATVFSDSPKEPRLVLLVQGNVKPLVEVRPEKTVYLQGVPDAVGEKSIDILSSLRTFHIRKIDNGLEGKAACRLETVEDGRHYRLLLSNLLKQGNYRGSVTLHTDLADKPEITIWVSGFIEGEIGVRPNSLILGRLAPEQPILSGKVLVVSNRKKPFHITKCTYDEKAVRLVQEPAPDGSGFSLDISPNMSNVAKGGRVQTTVTIETDVPSEGKHEVQIQVINLE